MFPDRGTNSRSGSRPKALPASQSTKSASASSRQARWRLKKTLGRKVSFRPIETEDIRYFYAAYRKGALADMGLAQGLDAREFSIAFQHAVTSTCDGAWTLFAETAQGFIPVGGVFAFWPHIQSEWMMVGGVAWFPWASPRNQVESIVSFFNTIRSEIPMVGFARPEHKRMYEVCASHGIMRRVGTSHNVFHGGPAAVFETRAEL